MQELVAEMDKRSAQTSHVKPHTIVLSLGMGDDERDEHTSLLQQMHLVYSSVTRKKRGRHARFFGMSHEDSPTLPVVEVYQYAPYPLPGGQPHVRARVILIRGAVQS